MRFLFILIFLVSCGKPEDPRDVDYPVFVSRTAIIGGTEQSCDNCMIMEFNGRALRMSFGANSGEECEGQGSLMYLANSQIIFPEDEGLFTETELLIQGDNSFKKWECFPSILSMIMTKRTDGSGQVYFELDYNGKFYTIKKLN